MEVKYLYVYKFLDSTMEFKTGWNTLFNFTTSSKVQS